MSILIVGAGKSGQWALKLGVMKGLSCHIYDDRDISLLDTEFVEYCQSNEITVFSIRDWPNLGAYEMAVISPGVPPKNPVYNALLSKEVTIISEVEFAFSFCEGDVIGITGSNGKTTVTGLTNHILQTAGLSSIACGNYGIPFSKALIDNNFKGYYVVELSSFQLELVDRFKPKAAAVLNLSPDHLDRYENCDNYYLAKFNIFKNMSTSSNCFINEDDMEIKKFKHLIPVKSKTIGEYSKGFSVSKSQVLFENNSFLTFDNMKLKGKHNLYNIAFAASLAKSVGVENEDIFNGVSTFVPISHRLEFVREINGVEFYNDSKATNFDAVIKAVNSFDSIHLIAGGLFKGGDFESVKAIAHERVKQFYIIGENTDLFMEEFGKLFQCNNCVLLENAVNLAYRNAKNGDVVLLAPGTASYDQFKNYEIRGDMFKEIVMGLVQ